MRKCYNDKSLNIPIMRTYLLAALIALPGLLTAQSKLQQIGHLSYAPLSLAGCWHYVDDNGREWALIGTSAGVSIVDMSQPSEPVERFTVPGLTSNWRELRTWDGFAYVGTEAAGSGITIIDLHSLPDTVYWKVWKGDGAYADKIDRSHTVQTADGFLYIFGGGNITNGAVIADLADPWNPHIIGKYTLNYVHDGFIRGDTLWTSEIYNGQFGVVNITDKTDPQLLVTAPTPGAFNHNTGLSDDSKYLFSTDEKYGSPLGSFDVSNLENITLLDRYFPSQKPTFMVHNVRVFGNYLINPAYGGQLTIVDATHPDNLIETAWAVVGNSLVWDADPYLPSGIVFATAKNEGLFVFQPTYQHAAWLQGLVTDTVTGQALDNAKVFVMNTANADTTLSNGLYKTGADSTGFYMIQVTRDGYNSRIISNVALTSGVTTTLNVALTESVVSALIPGNLTDVRVWPTAFSDHLTVEMPIDSRYDTAQLLDAQGKVVLSARLAGPVTDIRLHTDLPSGNYVLQLLRRNGDAQTFQVVKEE